MILLGRQIGGPKRIDDEIRGVVALGDGSSAQNEDAGNMTLVGAWGQLFVALSSQLFWNIPWNGGMARPVTMKIPEGTFLNCRYPAACGDAPAVGGSMTAAASECIAKMLYAAGLEDDVNASWYGSGGAGDRIPATPT